MEIKLIIIPQQKPLQGATFYLNIWLSIPDPPNQMNLVFQSNHDLTNFQEDGLTEVNSSVEADVTDVETQLKQVLEDLSIGCAKYVTISKDSVTGPGTGKTKLDKEHLKLCQREIVSIRSMNNSEIKGVINRAGLLRGKPLTWVPRGRSSQLIQS